jgi:Rrf2 family protein
MRFSQSTEYAIDSMTYMAAHPGAEPFYAADIAAAQKVSPSYLAKVFQHLARAGMLRSFRGAKGGYTLGRAAEEISLKDIVQACEGDSPLFACYAPGKECRLGSSCVVVGAFREAEGALMGVLGRVTLADAARCAGEHPGAVWWDQEGRRKRAGRLP